MSIADHFEQAPDASFIRNYDSGFARRQFNVSLVLAVVIALAAAALGVLIHFDTPSSSSAAGLGTVPTPSYAGKL